MPRRSSYNSEDLRKAVAVATSFAQVLSILGLRAAGGNYKHLRDRLEREGLDFSHFQHQAWAKNRTLGPRRPLSDYLDCPSKFKISSYALKKRLLMDGLLKPFCSSCELATWRDVPIPLELDHINGVNQDNRLENLRLLCPNCHALTSTYRGKNKGRNQ